MPLASWSALHFYGPAAGAMVVDAPASTVAGLNATARAVAAVTASATVPLAKPTRLVNSPLVVTASASMPQAVPKARARAGAIVRVGSLTQDDVTGAVLTAPVEGSLTMRDVLRLLLSVAVGETQILAGPVVKFSDTSGTKERVIASMTGSQRTTITLDPS